MCDKATDQEMIAIGKVGYYTHKSQGDRATRPCGATQVRKQRGWGRGECRLSVFTVVSMERNGQGRVRRFKTG